MSSAGGDKPLPTSKSTSWADDDSDDSADEREFREKLAMPLRASRSNLKADADGDTPSSSSTSQLPSKEDAPVASLASRISGLSTSNDPSATNTSASIPPPSGPSSSERPRPQQNNLFGRALAGVKTDRASDIRQPPSGSSASASASASASQPSPPAQPAAAGKKEAAEGQSSSRGKELLSDTKSSSAEAGKGKMALDLMEEPEQWGGSNGQKNAEDDGGWGGGPAKSNGNDRVDKPAGVDNFLDAKMGSESGASGLLSNDFQVEVKLADLQADPNSPLYSVKDFGKLGLHPDLIKGIYGVGFKKPSKIQERALPLLLGNPPRNFIGQSQSGTGKTAAFTLNVLARVSDQMMTPQAIVLAPSRELARQIQKVFDDIGQFTGRTTFLAVPGGWSRNSGTKIDKQILIGTPGTILDMLSRGTRIFDPKQIRVLVLDEADEMVAMQGLGDQSRRVKKALPPGTQRVLFSATFPPEVREFAQEFAPEANQIFLKQEEVTVDAIKQLYLQCDGEDQKYEALSSLYDVMTIGQSIVFCKRRDTADRVAQRLQSDGHSVASLHGEKEHRERDETLDSFRNGKTKVLITTNVVARGIDIQQVNMVVNYDIPDLGPEGGFRPDVETYIHRIGRTGRFGRKGCSVTFTHNDRTLDEINQIMQATGRSMKRIDATSKTDLDQLEKALKAAMKGPA